MSVTYVNSSMFNVNLDVELDSSFLGNLYTDKVTTTTKEEGINDEI